MAFGAGVLMPQAFAEDTSSTGLLVSFGFLAAQALRAVG